MVRSSLMVAMAACLTGQSAYANISLKVTSDQGNQSSPYLYGAMFEVKKFFFFFFPYMCTKSYVSQRTELMSV